MFLTRQWLNVALCGASLGLLGVTGCMDRPHDVPATAELRVQGRDHLMYTADRDGTAWIANKDTHKIVYSTRVHPGDQIALDSTRDQITLNGRVVLNTQVSGAPHKIFFQPGYTDVAVVPSSTVDIDHPAAVANTAMLVGEGKQRIDYTARTDGTVWVTDRTRDRVIYSGRIVRGDVITVDADHDLIALNGNRVTPRIAIDHVDHRVFFQPMEAVPAASVTVVPDATRTMMARPAEVPEAATLRVTSYDPIEFTPDLDGSVWVVTKIDNRVIYTGRIMHGDHLIVNPQANAFTLNGRSVYTRPLARDEYRIYYLASAR